MLRFFRQIRQGLLTDNKFSKYLLYAVGEIALVVIGILIALQVNDWSEQRKNREFEYTMLREVDLTLNEDLAIVSQGILSLKSYQHHIRELTVMQNDPSIPTDSLLRHLEGLINFGLFLEINRSPYDAIKSAGMDRISNVAIRNNLSALYGNLVPNTERLINVNMQTSLDNRGLQFQDLFDVSVVTDDSDGIEANIVIPNPDVIYDPKFDDLLITSGWFTPLAISQLESVKEKMELLDTQINQELKNQP